MNGKEVKSEAYQICIPNTQRDYFSYTSGGLEPCIGGRVWVPFGQHTRLGIVIGKDHLTPPSEGIRLKPITCVIDAYPLFSDSLLTLCTWVSQYYQSPLSQVLPLALPKKYRLGEKATLLQEDFYQLTIALEDAENLLPKKATKLRALVQCLAASEKPVAKKTLVQKGFSTTQLFSLLKSQLILLSQEINYPPLPHASPTPQPVLHFEQTKAVAAITHHLHHYHCFLLQGITGSGKTEVYLQVITHVLKQKKQVLILVPEIGLTPQLLARFTSRFQQPVAVIHSHLNETERQTAWQLAMENKIQMVIGTRTAVFTPMPNLGLIVIDEEHDTSLKQMEGVRYSARDTALMRAHLTKIPIVLGSATPSLESLYNCQQGKYSLLQLNHKAASTSPLQYTLVDLRAQVLQQGLATPTLIAIEKHLQQGNQVLIFINRRGFSPVILCHHCGWITDCKACDSHLTFHKQLGQMICHHCGWTQKAPLSCPNCHAKELIPVGAGTQRIHEFLSLQFPEINTIRIDRDEVKKKHALHQQLNKIHDGEAQLIVGTQMLAKGHHFPRLSLVVVLDADAGLSHQDFRAEEHLGQLLTQVAGRAGREAIQGQVIIQTHSPHHPLLNLLIQQGYNELAKTLLIQRKQAELPPFRYLALIRAQGKSSEAVLKFLQASKDQLNAPPLTTMGPAPAPLARKANQHRMQLLIKSPTRKALKNALTKLRLWLTINKAAHGVRWNVDIDPVDLS